MKRNLQNLFLLALIGMFLAQAGLLADSASAQELKKIRADYHSGGVQYSPDDPWTRSKVFQAHTGHSGFFYNCDNEECKRNSPYIYWKSNPQPLWPERIPLFERVRIDLEKVRWRVNAGGCGCQYCLNSRDCQTCSDNRCQATGTCTSGCHHCAKESKANSTRHATLPPIESLNDSSRSQAPQGKIVR